MKKLIHVFAKWLYQYGVKHAGMPSIRGSYEAPVPECLKETR